MKTKEKIYKAYVQGYTPTQMAKMFKISRQAVYKHINNLKSEGVLAKPFTLKKGVRGSLSPLKRVRLHRQVFKIKIFKKGNLGLPEILRERDFTIQFFKRVLVFHCRKEFYGDSPQHCLDDSLWFLRGALSVLEHKYKLVLVRGRFTDIRMVMAHWADVNNEFAYDLNKKKEKFEVFSSEDGRLWCLVDFSLGRPELEFLHGRTGMDDIEKFKHFFDDMRKISPDKLVLYSEVLRRLGVDVDGGVVKAQRGLKDYIG